MTARSFFGFSRTRQRINLTRFMVNQFDSPVALEFIDQLLGPR